MFILAHSAWRGDTVSLLNRSRWDLNPRFTKPSPGAYSLGASPYSFVFGTGGRIRLTPRKIGIWPSRLQGFRSSIQNVMRTESVTAPLSDISERVLSVLPDLLSSFLLY